LYARGLLRSPITAADARAAVQARLATRVEGFLDTVERAIFAHPGSPYRPLLEAAGYTPTRLKALVFSVGLEGALRGLVREGVYVSIEEFKGLRAAVRSGRTFSFREGDFNNPLAAPGFRASSGATRSRGVVTTISIADHLMGAQHLTLALAAYGLQSVPVAVWLPRAHGASLWAVLAFAAMRNAPQRWFTQIAGRFSSTIEPYSYYFGIKGGRESRPRNVHPDWRTPDIYEARGHPCGGRARLLFTRVYRVWSSDIRMRIASEP